MIASATNTFGIELWRYAAPGNHVVSPASIAIALAMAWTGARGATEKQMRKVLHLDGDVDAVSHAWGQLAETLNAADTVALANRLFGERSYAFEQPFASRLEAAFRAPLERVDFAANADTARGRVNAWVAEQTKDKIRKLLAPGSVDSTTRLILVNAIYFMGKWLAPFEKTSTRDREFWLDETRSRSVPMMQRRGEYAIGTIERGKIIRLPYEGRFAMYVAIPDDRDGLAKLEHGIDFARWTRDLDEVELVVALPRFVAAPETANLKTALAELGIPLAFDPARADFTGMANPRNPADSLCVAGVYHKAFVKTDEEGTVAAAATAVSMRSRGLPRPVEQFVVDRPFVFFIAHDDLVLFMGRIVDPTNS